MGVSFDFKGFERVVRAVSRVCVVGLAVACTPVSPPVSAVGSPGCGRADLAFAGDVLLHQVIQSDAAGRPDGFAPAFAPITSALSAATVTIVNLEGPAAQDIGPTNREEADPGTLFDTRIYSGFPRFNYHPSIAGVLRGAGVDVVQTANNHALDRGPVGVDRTLAALAGAGLNTTGTVPRGAAGPWHIVRPVSGHRIAFLACTYSTNGLADPASQALGCYGNAPSIPTLIQSLAARPDIGGVILLPHWGTEYSATPSARQRQLAQAAADAGAIAVVGAHPHVPQPLDVLVAQDGRQVPVAWSLGNLISSQWRLEQRTGAILYLDLGRDAGGRLIAGSPRLLPTRVERSVAQGVAVYPALAVPQGAESLRHVQRVFGPDIVETGQCLAG